jgi:flagellar hook-associated protein 2
LIATTTSTQTITVENDVDTVKGSVQDFMNSYNEVLSYLKEKAQINPDTLQRGELSGDYSYKALLSDLRGISLGSIASPSSSGYNSLYSLGIGFNDSGEMIFADDEKFSQALNTSTTLVSDIFNATDGIATLIKTKVEIFTKTGGIISSSKNNIDSNLLYLTQSMKRVEDQLASNTINTTTLTKHH